MTTREKQDRPLKEKELQGILNSIKERYDTELVPIGIGSAQLRILTIRNLDEIIEKSVESTQRLPYWAKIWEASIVLASFIGEQKLKSKASVLELGAGMGVTGLFMAAWGNRVLMTDINENALLFARANVYLNDLEERVVVKKLDWMKPRLNRQFDYIVGSEIVYDRSSFPYLLDLLRKYLKPTGTLFLAEGRRARQSTFFPLMEKYFRYERRNLVMHSGDERYRISIYSAWHR